MGDGWLTSRPGHFTPGKDNRYPLYRRLGGPQGRCGRSQKISPPQGLDHRTVQPIANHYTDWINPAHVLPSVEKVGVVNCFVFHQGLGFSCQSLRQKERTVNPAVVGITLLLPDPLQIVRTFLLQSSRTGAFERGYKHSTQRDYSHASNLALPSQG
jgi:hypothetical protein